MDFYEVLDQVVNLLRSRRRLTYRTLRRQFDLDDTRLEDLKEEMLFAHPQVADEEGRGLVWIDDQESEPVSPATSAPLSAPARPQKEPHLAYTPQHLTEKSSPPAVLWKANASRSPCCLPTSKTRPS